MSRADAKSMDRLHGAIADKLTEALNTMQPGDKGLAAVINVARQFLKDNGIDSVPTPGGAATRVGEALARHPFDPAESMKQH